MPTFPSRVLVRYTPPTDDRKRLLWFGCVGFTGVLVNSALIWLLTERVGLHYLESSALATEGAILSNFALNHVWTFATLRNAEPVLLKLAKFNLVALGGMILTVISLFTLTHSLGWHYLPSNAVAVCSGAVWNYFANRRWTWAGTSAHHPAPTEEPAGDRQ